MGQAQNLMPVFFWLVKNAGLAVFLDFPQEL